MNIIYKFQIPIEYFFEIEMPQYSKIVGFQLQNENPIIWTVCDADLILVKRKFMLIGTGIEIPEDINVDFIDYIGTIQMNDAKLVWHLFDLHE